MHDFRDGFLSGLTISVVLVFIAGTIGTPGQVNRMKAECEKTLPRNQKCIITAIPKKETNHEQHR